DTDGKLDDCSADPVACVPGPTQIHVDQIWCEVCGAQERIVTLTLPSLTVKLRLP
ncbi:unnamed protein product, partial [Prorocentrum cordatum]